MPGTYPRASQYGAFPPTVRSTLTSTVAKFEDALKSLRNTKRVASNSVLDILSRDLKLAGFGEKPRRFAVAQKRFDVDRFNQEQEVGLEVEKGRVRDQFHLDLLKFHMIDQIRYGAVILPEVSREGSERPFHEADLLLEALRSRPDRWLRVEGVLLIGY